MTIYEKAHVSCDGYFGADAYVDMNERWNGWALPYFTYDEAVKVLDACVAMSDISDIDEWHYEADVDCFVYHDLNADEDVYCDGRPLDVDGEDVVAYPIGTGAWIWDEDM